MGLFDGVKDKLGFGNKAEWEQDAYAGEQEAYDEQYDDYNAGQDTGDSSNVIAFDAYNPDKFENIRINSRNEPRVAGYDSNNSSPFGTRNDDYDLDNSSAGYSSRANSRSSQADVAPSWGTPHDPSFIDHTGPTYSRKEVYEDLNSASSGVSANNSLGAATSANEMQSGNIATMSPSSTNSFSKASSSDPYSQFDSDVKQIHRDPAAHLEIVRPNSYADVEKVANAAKAGKSVVLDLKNTKPELAKRILDFSFGVASALNGTVDKVADRVFVFAKGSTKELSKTEREYLFNQGVL